MLERRGFLGALMGAGAAPLLLGKSALQSESSGWWPPASAGLADEPWDMSWLDRLTGKHKQVFDFSDMDMGLVVVKNWLDAHETVDGVEQPRAEGPGDGYGAEAPAGERRGGHRRPCLSGQCERRALPEAPDRRALESERSRERQTGAPKYLPGGRPGAALSRRRGAPAPGARRDLLDVQ